MNGIALGALIAALAPLFFTWISLRQRNDQSIEERMADRIDQVETALRAAQEANDDLRKENYELMRRNLSLERTAAHLEGDTK